MIIPSRLTTDGSNSPASGIVAQNCSGNVTNVSFSINTGDISGAFGSGIAAGLYGSTPISNCYNSGAVSGTKNVCGISQPVYSGTCNSEKCVNAGSISKGTTYLSTGTNTGSYYYVGGVLKDASGTGADANTALSSLNQGLESPFWGIAGGEIKPLALIGE